MRIAAVMIARKTDSTQDSDDEMTIGRPGRATKSKGSMSGANSCYGRTGLGTLQCLVLPLYFN